ncbi:MAG: hypothetical protein HC923_05240 [Myxococcales bacterium]|nr:hypothetical protein [Myxococcales bacterium]
MEGKTNMKQSELSRNDLLTKYMNLQDELGSLVSYIDDTRRALGGVSESLPSASDALLGITQATDEGDPQHPRNGRALDGS